MFRLLGVYQQLVCQLLSSLAVRFNAMAAAMVVVVCCGTGNWLGVGLQQCSYFVHKSQSADKRQTTHKNVYLCLGSKKSQIHKFSWGFVICVLDFWVCSSSILFFGCATHTVPMWLHFWWCHNHTPSGWICD